MVIPRFVEQGLKGGPIVVYDDGEQVRCFAHVREVVNAIIQLVDSPAAQGGVFNIGSDAPISIRGLAAEIIKRIDPRISIEFLPYHDAYGEDFEDVRRRVPDISKLERTIHYKPSMTLGEILDDIIRWKREQRQFD
jgi:UDP-glucose 4-epimerase